MFYLDEFAVLAHFTPPSPPASPEAQPQKEKLHGRKVFIADIIDPDLPETTDVKVAEAVSEILSGPIQQLNAKYNEVFQLFHQRMGKFDAIKTTQEGWETALTALEENLDKALDKARERYCLSQSQAAPQDRSRSLATILFFETLVPELLRKSKELHAQFTETQQTELKTLRTQMAAIEAVANAGDVAKQVEVLQAIYQQHLGANNNELLRFLWYAAIAIQKKNPQQSTLAGDLETKVMLLRCPDPRRTPNTLQQLNDYIKRTEEAKTWLERLALPHCNHFRNGQYLTNWSFVGFTDVADVKDNLLPYATGLFFLEQYLTEEKRCGEDAQEFCTFVRACEEHAEDLEDAVGSQFNRLLEKKLSNEIHACWNYALCLQTQAKVMQTSLQHFKAMAEKHAPSIHALTTQINEPSLVHLLDAAESANALVEPDVRVYKVIEQTLAREGARLLALTNEEKAFASSVFSRKPDWQVAESYLIKGFLRYLYFTKSNVDYEFEAVLSTLQFDPAYKSSFERLLAENKVFARLHQAYMRESDIYEQYSACKQMNQALQALHRTPPAEQDAACIHAFVCYHTARRAYESLELYGQNRERKQKRLAWVKNELDIRELQWKAQLDVREEKETKLGKLLYQALSDHFFSRDSQIREAANQKIKETLYSEEFPQTIEAGITLTLLVKWVLDRFVASLSPKVPKAENKQNAVMSFLSDTLSKLTMSDEPSPAEKQILESLFDHYQHDAKVRALCRWLYDTGRMETALSRFETNADENHPLRNIWLAVLSHYEEFREILKKEGCISPNSASYQAAQALYSSAKACLKEVIYPGTNEYYTVAKNLTEEMHEFLKGERISFRQD